MASHKMISMQVRNLPPQVSPVIFQLLALWSTLIRTCRSCFLRRTLKKASDPQHLLSQVVGIFINKKMEEYPSRTAKCRKMGLDHYLIINLGVPFQIGYLQVKVRLFSNNLRLLFFMDLEPAWGFLRKHLSPQV